MYPHTSVLSIAYHTKFRNTVYTEWEQNFRIGNLTEGGYIKISLKKNHQLDGWGVKAKETDRQTDYLKVKIFSKWCLKLCN